MSLYFSFHPQEKKQDTPSPLQIFQRLEIKELTSESERIKQEKIKNILQELDSLVGLTTIKKLIIELQAFIEIQKRRAKENLLRDQLVLHALFRGNPGTGKTTTARLMGKLFKELGVLKKGHIVEVERADLVGEYIGHTALKTRDQIQKAMGGVLFIDEAYSLARGGEKDFGKEAIDCLVKAMEDHKNSFILILAGYREEMKWFLQMNPGLRSRFPLHLDFPDYNIAELLAIAEQMLQQRQYYLTEEGKKELANILQEHLVIKQKENSNARLIRNIIEKSIRLQAVRLIDQLQTTRNDLMLITREDILASTLVNNERC